MIGIQAKAPAFTLAQSHETSDGDAPGDGDIVLVSVSARGWRLSDGRRALTDPRRLLGFIEQRDDVFEVMQLGEGFEWHSFASFDEAVAFAIDSGPRLARERALGVLAWIA